MSAKHAKLYENNTLEKLMMRVSRLLRLIYLQAPDKMVRNELELIRKSLDEIEGEFTTHN